MLCLKKYKHIFRNQQVIYFYSIEDNYKINWIIFKTTIQNNPRLKPVSSNSKIHSIDTNVKIDIFNDIPQETKKLSKSASRTSYVMANQEV